ncbi:MAG: hypothetical protein ACP5HG_02160 [Anaerolineae bacterium]
MKVHAVNTRNAADVRAFVRLPFTLYADCEQWTPPLVSSVKLALNRSRHPFYNHSDAAFFLAKQDGQTVGRIAVLENRRYNDYNNAKVAFFYYLDLVDDAEVAAGLIEAAAGWARERDLDTLLGPKGMLRSDPYGVLVEGFQYLTGMGLPYNYPYYARLLTGMGLEKEVDYLSGYMTGQQELSERLFDLAERIKQRRGFWIKSFSTKRELRSWLPDIQGVNNKAFTQVWGYYPIDEAEAQMIADQLLMVSDPRLMKVVMKGDEIAGFAFVFPDVARTLQATGGRLWPFGWIRLLIALKRTKRLLGNGIGLLPKHQGMGASALLYVDLHDTLRARGAEHLEIVQVMETNLKSLSDMNALGANWHKRYRVYRLAL